MNNNPRRNLLLADLKAGAQHSTESAAAEFHLSRAYVRDCWLRWHRDEKALHVVQWIRPASGKGDWQPVYAYGEGKDKSRPRPKNHAQNCRAWRLRHPERAAISRAKNRGASAVRSLDPVLAAMMGV